MTCCRLSWIKRALPLINLVRKTNSLEKCIRKRRRSPWRRIAFLFSWTNLIRKSPPPAPAEETRRMEPPRAAKKFDSHQQQTYIMKRKSRLQKKRLMIFWWETGTRRLRLKQQSPLIQEQFRTTMISLRFLWTMTTTKNSTKNTATKEKVKSPNSSSVELNPSLRLLCFSLERTQARVLSLR